MKNTMQTAIRVGLTFATLLVGLGGLPILGADPKGVTLNPNAGQGALKDGASQTSSMPWDFKSRSPIVAKIEKALLEPTEVNFTDLPLKDALEYLSEHHNVEILTDAKVLSEEGISTDTTVTLVMSGISLKSSLKLLLSPLTLDYVIRNDTLMITTEAVANDTYEIRVYNTSRLPNLLPRDLVDIITAVVEPGNWTIKKSPDTPATRVFAPAARPEVPSLNRTASEGANPVLPPAPAEHAAQTAAEAGGSDGTSAGSICAVANTLVIRQSRRVHDEIIELLDQLERQQAAVPAKPGKP